jgi:large subunit ribosomal protein L21
MIRALSAMSPVDFGFERDFLRESSLTAGRIGAGRGIVDSRARLPIVRASRTGGPVRRLRACPAVASGARQTISAGIMFAVIRTGGKQYKVAKDDVISVEKLAGEPGAAIELAEVLMIGEGAEVATGTPLLEGALVSATVVEQSRAPKIIVFKKQRRKNYRRKKGHRQHQTVLRITEIRGAGGPQADEGVRDGA